MKRMIALGLICMLAAMPLLAGDDDQAMMKKMEEAMVAAGTPGEHHQHLATLAGDYTYKAKAWMEPGAEPQEWEGERSAKMIMGGRYLHETMTGDFMGMPFEGMALYAYDNLADEYIATWVDNMSTSVLEARGTCSETGWTFTGTHMLPGLNTESPFKEVLRKVDDKTFVFEWHEAMPGQKEMTKMMEITYTKK